MLYRIGADLVFVAHLWFLLFVGLGALAVWRWPRLAWVHVPAMLWAAKISFLGGPCPLTPLEKILREAAGAEGYQGGFIQHYLIPVIYPDGLTRGHQIGLGMALVILNVWVYWRLWRRARSVLASRPGS